MSQSKHTILATSDASLAAPALGIYSVHVFMVDDGSSATIAAARVGAQERIRAAALDSEGDSQHKVLLRIRAPPNVRVVASVRVVAPTALVDEPPRLLAEGTKRLDREALIQVAQRLLFDHLLVAGALGLAIAVGGVGSLRT